MKKVLFLVVGAIYILGIVLVTFLGMQVSSFEVVIYAEQVVCVNPEVNRELDGRKTILLDYEYEYEFPLIWKVYPVETTNSIVEFVYNKSETLEESKRTTVSNSGVVTFRRKNSFTVKIVTTDGSNKSETIQFNFRP